MTIEENIITMKSIILFTLLFSPVFTYSQNPNNKIAKRGKKFVKEVSNAIKLNSLFSDSLDWKVISEELSALPLGISDSTDHKTIISYFTKKLRDAGDKHSFFLTETSINSYIEKNIEVLQPEGKYLGVGIGLIKVPRCMTFNNKKDRDFANSIRNEIREIDSKNEISGWIVDLRNNSGGNMWPMIAGLNALLEDGTIGYLVGTTKKKEKEWKTINGKINSSEETIDRYKVKKPDNKIAVLIDSMTASSGEMTAISFIGLPNVRLFGQPSAGYTTVNSTINLPGGVQLYLATNFVADRTQKKYYGKIIPDEIINTQSSFPVDETLEHAKRWILLTGNK